MKFFVFENKALKIDSVTESDIFFIVKDGYLKSLGLTVDDGEEIEGVYIEKYQIEWVDLEFAINLKDFYELIRRNKSFQEKFSYLKTSRLIKINKNKVEIDMSLMLLFLKIIDLFFSTSYTHDIIQKLRILQQYNESYDDTKIKELNSMFVNYILYSDTNFNINERKLELNLEDIKKQKIQLMKKVNLTDEEKDKIKNLSSEIESLELELKAYSHELNKVNNAISKLKVPADVLTETKIKIENRIEFFNMYAGNILKIFIPIYSLIMFCILCYLLIDQGSSINLVLYFTIFFPLAFSTLLSFLLFRQGNLKVKELEEVNKRFILIHDVNQSLKALVEVNIGKDMHGKTEEIIDKLIINILNYTSSKITYDSENNSNSELNGLLSNLANLKTVTS